MSPESPFILSFFVRGPHIKLGLYQEEGEPEKATQQLASKASNNLCRLLQLHWLLSSLVNPW